MRPDFQRPSAVPDTLTPGDQLLAAGLGVGAAAGGLVWASGQLAGLAFGHTWLHLDPADVAGVLWQLPHHLGDPAMAWPASARDLLPGPAGMYGAFTATTAATAATAGGVLRLWQRAGLGNPTAAGSRVKQPAAGSATWASPRELRPLRVRRPEPGRVILGRTSGLGGRLLAGEDCHSVLVFGPPGSFKTTGLVIPTILEWAGPVLATSVKPDVIKATRAHRERLGEVVVLDPLGASGLARARWTPLAFCRTWAGAQQTAATIAATADLGTLATAEHKYWKTLGQKLLAPLLFAAARDGRSMTDVLRWIDLREDNEVAKLLGDSEVDGAITAWEASQSRTDKARDSVYGTAEDLLAIYADQRVQAFTSGHDLAEDAFLQGDHTVYLYAPVHEQRRLRPLFETVAMQLVQTAQEKAARAPDGMLSPRLLCALDEAGNVAALELLPEWATTGRGQGIQLLSVWHDQAQLVHRYGDRAATILNGHRAKVFLSGLADVGALELGSKLIGDQAVTETNYATDPTGRVSAAQATSYRPLVPLEELRRLQPGEGVVIYGHLRPARIQVRPHFTPREQRWRQRLQRQSAQQQARQARRAAHAQQPARRSGCAATFPAGSGRGRRPAVTADPTPTLAASSSSGRHPFGTVYLLHFDQRYEHAGHYTGWAEDLDQRLAEHLGGRAARLIEVITQAGIGFRLARTWPGVTRARERQLKRQGGASRYCPICQEDRKARGLPRRPPRSDRAAPASSRRNGDRPRPRWASAVPSRGTRPERVAAFLELNPKFALPAGASQAKQWGRARGREQIELLTPRVTTAAFEENQQPSQHRVATITRRAVQARLQARQHRNATRAEQGRTRDLAARTHQRLTSRQQPPTRGAARGSRAHPTREERDRER